MNGSARANAFASCPSPDQVAGSPARFIERSTSALHRILLPNDHKGRSGRSTWTSRVESPGPGSQVFLMAGGLADQWQDRRGLCYVAFVYDSSAGTSSAGEKLDPD